VGKVLTKSGTTSLSEKDSAQLLWLTAVQCAWNEAGNPGDHSASAELCKVVVKTVICLNGGFEEVGVESVTCLSEIFEEVGGKIVVCLSEIFEEVGVKSVVCLSEIF
jgi:hypothetical protein